MNLIKPRSNIVNDGPTTRTEHWDGRRDVLIRAPTAVATQRHQPTAEQMQHHCPFCDRTYAWGMFRAHLVACLIAHADHPEAAKIIAIQATNKGAPDGYSPGL